MTLMTRSDKELYERLRYLAATELLVGEEDSVYEVSGGNIDDAYEAGVDDGYALLARNLLQEFFGATHGIN